MSRRFSMLVIGIVWFVAYMLTKSNLHLAFSQAWLLGSNLVEED